MVGKDLGGERGRRLQYWPVSGRARQSYVAGGSRVDEIEVVKPQRRRAAATLNCSRGRDLNYGVVSAQVGVVRCPRSRRSSAG